MKALTLPPTAALAGAIHLPGSKSISNRALLLAAMAEGETRISNLLRSDDTDYMVRALRQLGINIDNAADANGDILVAGVGGPLVTTEQTQALQLGLAGTALRPLTAARTRA